MKFKMPWSDPGNLTFEEEKAPELDRMMKLCVEGELSPKEIGQQFGCSGATVCRRFQMAAERCGKYNCNVTEFYSKMCELYKHQQQEKASRPKPRRGLYATTSDNSGLRFGSKAQPDGLAVRQRTKMH